MKIYRLGYIICLILILSACGGGGGSGDGDILVDDENLLESNYFVLVENGIDKYLDHSAAPADQTTDSGIMKVFDGNKDGYPDLLHVASYFRLQYTGNGPSFGIVNYLENNRQGKFVNKTVEVFGTTDLSTAPRKIKFLDMNTDGVVDIFFASSREDGRLENGNNIGANIDIFLSQLDGTFRHHLVGISAWTHDVQVGDIDSDGTTELIDGNFTHGTRLYDLNNNGGWAETTSELDNPSIFSALTNELSDFSGDDCLDLISPDLIDHLQMAYNVNDCNSDFSYVGAYGPTINTFMVPGETWNGSLTNFEVADLNGQWVAGLGQDWSHSADYDNDGDNDILYIISSFLVSDSEKTNNFIIEDGDEDYTLVTLLKNTPSGLQVVENPIVNFPSNLKIYWATFADLNGNGLMDLVVDNPEAWKNGYGLNDVIFLNRGDGTFIKLDENLASGTIIDEFTSVTPIDVNQDGIIDIVLRNMCIKNTANCNPSYANPFRLLLGKKKLPTP